MVLFPFEIGEQINSSFFRQVIYEPWNGRWVVIDGDRSKAELLKQMMPHAYVFLYDKEHDTYTRFTIDLVIPKMIIKNGAFVEEFEKWTV